MEFHTKVSKQELIKCTE